MNFELLNHSSAHEGHYMSASYLKVLLLIQISNIFLVQPKIFASIMHPDTSSGYEFLHTNIIKIGQDFLKTHIKIDHCQIRIKKDKEDIVLTDISNKHIKTEAA